MSWLLLLGCREPEPGVANQALPEPDTQDTGAGTLAEVVAPAVWFNEVQPENDSTWQASDGSRPAWVEIRNASSESVQRSDLSINGEALAWVDGEETLPAGALAMAVLADGGSLALTWQGIPTDTMDPGDPGADMAWARFDGAFEGDASGFLLTPQPTPGYDNGTAPPDGTPSDLLFADYARYDLTIPQASWDALALDPYTGVPATLAYERVSLEVTAHLKGVYGSLRTLEQKASFSIDLNGVTEGGSIRGLKKLKLNNMVQDPSGTHETLTYQLYRSVGLPAPRTGYAQVYVNGDYYGVYVNVEAADSEFLDRNFGQHDGNLYEGAYGVDFYDGYEPYFECDECAYPDDRSDITAVTNVLNGSATNAAIADLDELVDLDQFLTYMAVEAITLHWDGYTTANNYRIFHDPGDDRFVFLPWGTDQTWIDAYYDPWSGYGRVLTFCIANPSCEAEYNAKLLEIADQTEALNLTESFVELVRTYDADFVTDPRVEWAIPTHETYLRATQANLEAGPERVRGQVGAR